MSSTLTLENPVFAAYAVAAALMVLKVMGQGWMTVLMMTRHKGGYVSPEDLRRTRINPEPHGGQLLAHPEVERSRRMHRNDLENIPAFLAIGLLFVTTEPPVWLAVLAFGLFVLARAGHAVAYATARDHDTRAVFYSVGSVVVILMALWVLVAAVL
jgi:uncharacterized MAPEG superfamily protein